MILRALGEAEGYATPEATLVEMLRDQLRPPPTESQVTDAIGMLFDAGYVSALPVDPLSPGRRLLITERGQVALRQL